MSAGPTSRLMDAVARLVYRLLLLRYPRRLRRVYGREMEDTLLRLLDEARRQRALCFAPEERVTKSCRQAPKRAQRDAHVASRIHPTAPAYRRQSSASCVRPCCPLAVRL